MLMPSIFSSDFMDDFFDVPSFRTARTYSAPSQNLMNTDVLETENGDEIAMNRPGFKKEDVTGEVKDGYLIIKATSKTSNDEKDANGKYIRKERFEGSCSRSFYVGDSITQDDIKAKFEDGVLKISVPKQEAKPKVEDKKFIPIEG